MMMHGNRCVNMSHTCTLHLSVVPNMLTWTALPAGLDSFTASEASGICILPAIPVPAANMLLATLPAICG